jgi:ketosteroid isomerase-like protein
MVFRDTAIAMGPSEPRAPMPLDVNERFTDTWTKMADGKWQCVASHQSPIKM